MNIPEGWFILSQPKVKTPSVFDLHERGLFTSMPYVHRKSGACIIINDDLQVSIYYKYITEKHQNKNNIAYYYLAQKGLIRLTEDIKPNAKELSAITEADAKNEIMKVYEEWHKSYIPIKENGDIDKPELEKKLKLSLDDGKKLFREELKQKNSSWIDPALKVMTWRFMHTLYGLVFDELYPDYRTRGGAENENGLIKKIQMFCRIYENNNTDNLIKPDGKRWQNDDEIWDCWVAYSGSESEAKRICQSMEAVFRPIYARLS